MTKMQAPEKGRKTHPFWLWLKTTSDLSILAVGLFLLFVGYGTLPNRWYRSIYVYSGSMSPAIESGDVIIITPAPEKVLPGMIVTLRVDGYLVTHRLIDVKPDGGFTTKGDANIEADEWGNAKVSMVGVYRARIPYLGYVFAAMQHLVKLVPSGAWFVDRETVELQLNCCVQQDIVKATLTATPTATATPPPGWVPSSTDIPTEIPTETPTGTATLEPTAIPTDAFTETPTPTSTETLPAPPVEPTETQLPAQPTETQSPEPPAPLPSDTPAP